MEEQLSGWYTLLRRSKDPGRLAHAYRRLADTVGFFGQFKILSFTEPAIQRYTELASLKLGVKHMDLRIAAIVLEFGATLVTSNTADFKDIPGLATVDWRLETT